MSEHKILRLTRQGDLDSLKSFKDKELRFLYQTGITGSGGDEFSNKATPLYVACKNDNSEVVKFLIGKGVDVNLGLKFGLGYKLSQSPLHIAIEKKHIRCVELLVEGGADFSRGCECASDRGGRTIEDCIRAASNCGNRKISEFVKKHSEEKKKKSEKEKENKEEEESDQVRNQGNVAQRRYVPCEQDIRVVMVQSSCSREASMTALIASQGDIVDAVMMLIG